MGLPRIRYLKDMLKMMTNMTNQTIAFGGPCLVNPKNGLGVLNFGHAKIKAPFVKFFWSRKLYRLTGFEDYFNWCIERHRKSPNDSTGWWFGTFFIYPYIGNSNHQLTNIFQRG